MFALFQKLNDLEKEKRNYLMKSLQRSYGTPPEELKEYAGEILRRIAVVDSNSEGRSAEVESVSGF